MAHRSTAPAPEPSLAPLRDAHSRATTWLGRRIKRALDAACESVAALSQNYVASAAKVQRQLRALSASLGGHSAVDESLRDLQRTADYAGRVQAEVDNHRDAVQHYYATALDFAADDASYEHFVASRMASAAAAGGAARGSARGQVAGSQASGRRSDASKAAGGQERRPNPSPLQPSSTGNAGGGYVAPVSEVRPAAGHGDSGHQQRHRHGHHSHHAHHDAHRGAGRGASDDDLATAVAALNVHGPAGRGGGASSDRAQQGRAGRNE
jgi:hypothetical protein